MNNFGALIGLVCIFIIHTTLAYSPEGDAEPMYKGQEDEARSGWDDVDDDDDRNKRPNNQNLANYVNKRILLALQQYPEKTEIETALDTVYNREREKLAKSLLPAVNRID